MRTIQAARIRETVARLCVSANCELNPDVIGALKKARRKETSALGRTVLDRILENARIAQEELMPACQDTGYAIVWVRLGQEVRISGGRLNTAVNQGVRKGYREGYLRKSIVRDPLDRVNTGDNTPAVIHTEIVPGSRLKITVEIKGAGSENMSRVAMLKPADGEEGVKAQVVEWVKAAGAKACPPYIVGVGIGGDLEQCAILAKRALLKKCGERHRQARYARLERDLLKRINAVNIGPQGFGGITTALDVHVTNAPCHIACLPVALNIDCHVHRTKTAIL